MKWMTHGSFDVTVRYQQTISIRKVLAVTLIDEIRAIQCIDFEKMSVVKRSHYLMNGVPQNAIDKDIKLHAIGVTKNTFFSQ